MENKDTNTDSQKFVRVGDQKWAIIEIASEYHFFAWNFYSLFFYTGSFQVPPEKNHSHLKCQFSPKIQIWSKWLLYKRSEKWLSSRPPPPPTPRSPKLRWGGGGGISKNIFFTEHLWATASDFSFSRFLSRCKMSQKRIDDLKWFCENNPTPNYERTKGFSWHDSINWSVLNWLCGDYQWIKKWWLF